jgi:hypothetical protein
MACLQQQQQQAIFANPWFIVNDEDIKVGNLQFPTKKVE